MLEKEHDCFACSKECASKFSDFQKGLSEQIVRSISAQKNEPTWMLEFRLKSFEIFNSKELPKWGPDLTKLDLNEITYYVKPSEKQETSWSQVPQDIKQTFDDLGLQEAEKKYLGGLGAQYESEVVYHNLKKEWEELGVIFVDTDTALKKHENLFKKYFGTVVPAGDNKFSALNSAVWSGGSFIYVPKNVHVTVPLQAYYRINAQGIGQFERTLIIADEGSTVSYVEGCTAPNHTTNSLHSAVVEIIALKNARVRYYTIQNWSKNVYNLVTKRAVAYENALVEWIDGNFGSGITMKYPTVILKENGARAEVLSLAVAAAQNQIQDAGAKAMHLAPNTSSKIISKSISSNGGRSSFRGAIRVAKNAVNSKSYVECNALLMDAKSQADAYPYIDVMEKESQVGHEATVSKIADEKIFYLMSRGLNLSDAQGLIINGFIEPFIKELPMEYAVEINRLMEMELKGECKDAG
jgi:Fe-S cluster assembly protein SufB